MWSETRIHVSHPAQAGANIEFVDILGFIQAQAVSAMVCTKVCWLEELRGWMVAFE
jgi:hypothetical protein